MSHLEVEEDLSAGQEAGVIKKVIYFRQCGKEKEITRTQAGLMQR